VIADIIANRLEVCTRVVSTQIVLCARDKLALGIETETYPAMFAFAQLGRTTRSVDASGQLAIHVRLNGWLGKLQPGSYEIDLGVDGSARIDIRRGADRLTDVALASTTGRGSIVFALRCERRNAAHQLRDHGPDSVTARGDECDGAPALAGARLALRDLDVGVDHHRDELLKVTFGCQPRSRRALEASPCSRSTSAGRICRGSRSTNSRQSRFARPNASSRNSFTLCVSPVATT